MTVDRTHFPTALRLLRTLAVRSVLLILVASAAPVHGQTGTSQATESNEDSLAISSELRVRIERGREIVLEVLAARDDSHETVAERVCGTRDHASAIAAWNGDASVVVGAWTRVPLALLSPDHRALVLINLFPEDRRDGDNWVHFARAGKLPTYDEGLWQVAEWFTGDGATFQDLMRVNGFGSPELRRGQRVLIPAEYLVAGFRSGIRSEDGLLEFGSDGRGPFAGYRLRPGEALYSAVIVRFTGRTGADDVRELAARIQKRSGIRDLTDIPVGYTVKIPLELLEPEFLPASHPRRLEAERAQEELALALAQEPLSEARGGLEGVLVILDPGHGGKDLGTTHNGIWEHDYVYDVACRLKRRLESETAAKVMMTLEDAVTGCVPSNAAKLKANRQGTILTTPPFLAKKNGDSKTGVKLRWYLANSIYRNALKNGTPADRIMFISIHADARHPSLRGVMVYVPGAPYRTRTYGSNDKFYRKFKEVREKPHVQFSKKERVRSEAVSRKFADGIIRSFRERDLPVQKHIPVRNRVIRGKSTWVPAVLRANAVPNKVLVELVNLTNREDADLLAAPGERQRLAEALLDSLFDHFGETDLQASAGGRSR